LQPSWILLPVQVIAAVISLKRTEDVVAETCPLLSAVPQTSCEAYQAQFINMPNDGTLGDHVERPEVLVHILEIFD
jgi:hypothetical protein